MKNILTILKDLGIEVPEETREKLTKEVSENYKTINEYQKQAEKIDTLEKTVKETQETLTAAQEEVKKFEGVDTDALNEKIKSLEETITNNEKEYLAKIEDRDFSDKISKAIANAKGLNETAIKALLKVDDLKASKNQDKDIEDAIKALTQAENSKMLFGTPEPEKKGNGNPIGSVSKGGANESESLTDALHEYYS